MNIKKLCDAINLQDSIAKEVITFYNSPKFESICKELEELKRKDTDAMTIMKQTYALMAPDDRQIKMLTYMLYGALGSYERYMKLGISEEIYFATMKCFTRFIEECHRKTGIYAFDRGWWTGRQVGLQIFRIGELEYEMTVWNNENVISIHIPSDVNLSQEKCIVSVKESKKFFATYFPEYSECKYICDCWLLSPTLKEILPETSNIINFQNMFEIVEFKPEGMGYVEWVFHQDAHEIVPSKPDENGNVEMRYQKKELNMEEMPEYTSLQRKIKSHVLKGGSIGEGFGILKNEL